MTGVQTCALPICLSLQEHVLRAPKDGVVSRVIATVGELVPEGKVLVEFVEEDVAEEA